MKGQDLSFKTEQGGFTYRVGAIIIKDNNLLMVKHEDYPCYYTVGGRVRLNETSEEAIIREVYDYKRISLLKITVLFLPLFLEYKRALSQACTTSPLYL